MGGFDSPEGLEREEWQRFSLEGLSRAYDINEPEYTEADVKEFNPGFKAFEGK
jgi:hypothetical protein